MRYAAQRDVAEKPIVDALKARGVIVFKLSGKGLPDLLCHFRGQWTPLEVKSAKRIRHKKQQLTEAQQLARVYAPYAIVETPEQAIVAIFGVKGERA